MNGKVVWQRHLGKEISPFDINWGHSSSPTLFQDSLILLCDHAPASYLLAVDKRTGKDRWKADRGTGRMSYTHAVRRRRAAGPELIVNSSERVDAYDPRTGTLLWHVGGIEPVSDSDADLPRRRHLHEPRLSQRSVHGDPARRPRRHLDVARRLGSEHRRAVHLVARLRRRADLHGQRRRRGDGRRRRRRASSVWQERVDGIFSASPVAADGKIYFVSETGETIVLPIGTRSRRCSRATTSASG